MLIQLKLHLSGDQSTIFNHTIQLYRAGQMAYDSSGSLPFLHFSTYHDCIHGIWHDHTGIDNTFALLLHYKVPFGRLRFFFLVLKWLWKLHFYKQEKSSTISWQMAHWAGSMLAVLFSLTRDLWNIMKCINYLALREPFYFALQGWRNITRL